MPATKNLALIAVLCILGLVIYAITGDPEYTEPGESPASVTRIASIDPGTIEKVVLSTPGVRLELARDPVRLAGTRDHSHWE